MALPSCSRRPVWVGSAVSIALRMVLTLLICAGVLPLAGHAAQAAEPLLPSQRVIIQLRGRSMLAEQALLVGGRDEPTLSRALGAYRLEMERRQDEFVDHLLLSQPGATVERRFSTTFNGFSVRLPASTRAARDAVTQHPLVDRIFPEAEFAPTLFDSVQVMQAAQLWNRVGGADRAGAGVRVAIIDSGIQIGHPALSADGLTYPAGYPKGDDRFTTPKIIAARAYFRPSDLPVAGENTPIPGVSGSAHGTQMAGIVAGRVVTADFRQLSQSISGIAPGASLMNYRVFYPSAKHPQEKAFTSEIIAAIEDAVADGADVLCLAFTSLSPSLPGSSPLGEALEAAIGAGRIVVASAGNQGPNLGSASYLPGGLESVITAGAASKGRIAAVDLLDVTGPAPVPPDLQAQPFSRAQFGGPIDAPIAPASTIAVASIASGASPYACDPLPTGSLEGAAALIRRGGCAFAIKAHNVQQAGANLALIINDEDEITEMACEGAVCAPGTITIPLAMIGATAGGRLLDQIAAHPSTTLRLDPSARIIASEPNVILGQSGRGPAFGRYLKPDVVAPGVAVLAPSIDSQGSATYDLLSGASVAAAHVAGGAALLRQSHPNWNADQIRAALISTADTQVLVPETPGALAGPLLRGGGAVRLANASDATILPSPAKVVRYGLLPGASATLAITLSDVRPSGGARTLNVSTSASLNAARAAGLDVVPSGQVAVGPDSPGTLFVTIRAAAAAIPADYGGDLTLSGAGVSLHIPVWVRVSPQGGSTQVLLIDNDFSHFESYEDYAPYVAEALDAIGVSYQLHNADQAYGSPQTIPSLEELRTYDAVIWITGDNVHPDGYFVLSTPLTDQDQQTLANYLDAGGRLLAMGQNLAQASDISDDQDPAWGRSDLYHGYLGAHWLQGSLFGPDNQSSFPPTGSAAVVGLAGTFLSHVQLNLGQPGDGAGNQTSVDEVGRGGLWDGSDQQLVTPLLRAPNGSPVGQAYVGLAKHSDPTLEKPSPAVAYRTTYFSFGFEGINSLASMTSRPQLLASTLDWLVDQVSVALPSQVEAAPNVAITIACQATSSHGSGPITYRWYLSPEAGDPAGDGTLVETTEPSLTHTYSARGDYALTVEARDSLGHTAVASSNVRVLSGAGSSLVGRPPSVKPGEQIVYVISLSNSETESLPFAFSLPLPSGTQYQSSDGGTYAGAKLTWSGSLPPLGTHTATLRTAARTDLAIGTVIVATADITAGDDTLERTVRTLVAKPTYLPLVLRRH